MMMMMNSGSMSALWGGFADVYGGNNSLIYFDKYKSSIRRVITTTDIRKATPKRRLTAGVCHKMRVLKILCSSLNTPYNYGSMWINRFL